MHERPESYSGPPVTAGDDARITSLGRWLRDTKFNELPQLWNVLKGEMSLVGPRPEDPKIVAQWPEDIYNELLAVRPGITSPASVVYRNEETLLQSKSVMDDYLQIILPSKLRLDCLYVRNRTILTDLDVIFLTLVALLPQLKKKQVPEHLLYWGPLSLFVSRYFSWFLIDLLVALVSVGFVGVIWRTTGPLHLGVDVAIGIAFCISLLFGLINSISGLNRVEWAKARAADALSLAFSSSLVAILLMVVNRLWPPKPILPLGMIPIIGLLAFIGFVIVRYRDRLLTGIATRWIRVRGGGMGTVGERALIVGAGEAAELARTLLRRLRIAQAFTIIGLVDDDPRKRGMRIGGLDVIGRTNDIPDLVSQFDVGLILYAIADVDNENRKRMLSLCDASGARVVNIPEVLENMNSVFYDDKTIGLLNKLEDRSPDGIIATGMVIEWLSELETLLEAGDFNACSTKIEAIRYSIERIKNSQSHHDPGVSKDAPEIITN
jgi:hypothetical protein